MCEITIFNPFIISLAGPHSQLGLPSKNSLPRGTLFHFRAPNLEPLHPFSLGATLERMAEKTRHDSNLEGAEDVEKKEMQRITMTRGTDGDRKRVTDGICWMRVNPHSCVFRYRLWCW